MTRLIFVSNMSDALSGIVPHEYLDREGSDTDRMTILRWSLHPVGWRNEWGGLRGLPIAEQYSVSQAIVLLNRAETECWTDSDHHSRLTRDVMGWFQLPVDERLMIQLRSGC